MAVMASVAEHVRILRKVSPLVETTRRVVSRRKDAFHREETRQSETRRRHASTKIGKRVVPVFPHGGSSMNSTEDFEGECLDPSSFPTPETSEASASRLPTPEERSDV